MGRGRNTTTTSTAARPRRDTRRPDAARDRQYANLARIGVHAWDIGGGPRDDELGRPPRDRDYAVTGESLDSLKAKLDADVKLTGGKVNPLEIVTDRGRQHSGYRITAPWTPPEGIEIMLAREETSTGPRHQDFEITPIPADVVDELVARGMTLDEAHREVMRRDAVRRDWTVNQIMVNVITGETVDFFDGVKDLRDRKLRPISPDTCRDDPMRTLRGISRIAHDDLDPTDEATRQLTENAHRLAHLTQDKIFKEISKALKGRHIYKAFTYACQTGVLQAAIPEFAPSVGYRQLSPYHDLEAHEHQILAADWAARLDAPLVVRWSAFSHDWGKAYMGWSRPGETRRRFMAKDNAGMWDPARFSHQEWSAELADQALARSDIPKAQRDQIVLLNREHMYRDDEGFEQRTATQRKMVARAFIKRIGSDNVENLMLLRRCDLAAKGHDARGDFPETTFERVVRQELADCPLDRTDLAVKGGEIIEAAGLKQGPWVREIMDGLLRQVQSIDDAKAANQRSGVPLTEAIARIGDKKSFRELPYIERWAAQAIVDAQRAAA
jgi:tRNA nucleotidyltransferase (CCA-adding enzyme)